MICAKKYNIQHPNAWENQPTNDCKLFNKNGTTKPYELGSGNGRTRHSKKNTFATFKRIQSLPNANMKKMKIQVKDVKSTVKGEKASTTALLVAEVPIRTANRIVGDAIHQLANLDVMCLKTKMNRMLIVR